NGQIDRGADRLDRVAVGAFAGEGAVQIHAMQPLESLGGKAFGLRGGIGVEDGGVFHHALLQADTDAVLQINGRENDHCSELSPWAGLTRPSRATDAVVCGSGRPARRPAMVKRKGAAYITVASPENSRAASGPWPGSSRDEIACRRYSH